MENLENRTLLAGLNTVIDDVLVARFPVANPNPTGSFTFTSSVNPSLVPTVISVGTTVGGGTADLEIENVSLTFSDMAYVSGSWAGNVVVKAESGVLFAGLLDIPVDDGNDADDFAVVGNVSLSAGDDTSNLALDDIDGEEIGVPSFLDVQLTNLALNFADFRANENSSTLDVQIDFVGLDTGVAELNELMASDNPLFQLTLIGTSSATLDLTAIENAAKTSSDIVAAFEQELGAAVGEDLASGPAIAIAGKIFHVGDITGSATYHVISVDPDGNGPLGEETSGYLAVEGGFRVADEELGGRGRKFDIAFAISDLGPLQFFISMSPEPAETPKAEPAGTIKVESASFGVIFNKTVEELQTEIDFQASTATRVADGTGFLVTLTIPSSATIPPHDLEVGDSFGIVAANNDKYVGEYEVKSVSGNQVTFKMATDPGVLASASIIRRTIKEPLDLRDDGLRTGIAVPGSIIAWRAQLDASVRELIIAGDDSWRAMFGDMVIGGGATLSISDIPDTVLMMDVGMYLDTDLRIMLQGNMLLADGTVQVPASLYADLSELLDLNARFLFLADVGEVPLIDDPLLVLRGEATFDATTNGFQIALEGGVDLNIPEATTITLEGNTTFTFSAPSEGPLFAGPDLRIDLNFDAALSEAEIGDIAAVRGNFHLAIDVPNPDPNNSQLGSAEIWGAALVTTQLNFLEDVGLVTDASAVLRVNSSSTDKPDEVLAKTSGSVNVDLPAESFALRLDGSADLEFNGDSVARLDGVFVLEFSSDGFNAALFDEVNGAVVPASIAVGPSGSRLLEFGVLGFLAIRLDGIAADLVLTANAALPLGLAELNAAAVFIVNTTGREVNFTVPGGVAGVNGALDPNRPTGATLRIPKAAPSNPSAIVASGLSGLITGSPTWTEATAGAYGVVFVVGDLDVLSVLELDVSGYILLSEEVVSLQASFDADANFLDLVSGSVSGSLFFSSEGEFQVVANGNVQLGPDGFNIAGTAALNISYLDSNGTAFGGDQNFVLDVSGSVGVSAEVFYIPIGPLTLGIGYNSGTGNISVVFEDVPVPEIAWTTLDLGLLGSVDIPYPTISLKDYTFTVGTLTANAVQPPPPVLGQVVNGVLTLNVGPRASDRNLRVDALNEIVSIAGMGAGSTAGTEEIDISMFGVTQRFHNVTRIMIEDMGAGEDYVGILASVASTPVEVHFGAGDDTLDNDSSILAKAFGGEGRDRLLGGGGIDELDGGAAEDYIEGGAGNDILDGGDAADRLVGGTGADTIRGGLGADTIAGDGATTGTVLDANNVVTSFTFETVGAAAGGSDNIDGGAGDDTVFGGSGGDTISGNVGADRLWGEDGRITIQVGSSPVYTALNLGFGGADRFTWAVGNGNDTVDGQLGSDTLDLFGTDSGPEAFTITANGAGFTAAVGTASLSVAGVESSNVEGRGGSDTFTVNDLTTSLLRQVHLKLGSDSVQDTVGINGSSGADVFNVTTPVANTLRIAVPGGVTINVLDASSTSGADAITLETLAGADTINVNGTLAGTLTTVNAGDGGDLIHVGSNGSLNGIAGRLVVEGGADSDILNLSDTADTAANTGTLTATQITGLGMGSDGITYTGLETLNVNLGAGGDSVSVQDTAGGTANNINTGGGNDTITVYKTSLSGPVTLDGQAASDTYDIHLGSLAAPVTVADSGASGSDALNVYGVAGVNEIVLEFARLTRGAEVVNYSGVEALKIDTQDAGDVFTILDNGAATTINSGKGNDEFTIGPAVNEDGEVIDANNSGSNSDELLIKGTSFDMTINGGDDNDDFEVNRNTGELFLNGNAGNDVFVLNTVITGGDSNVDGGGGTDLVTYLQNAPVHINGGDGFDKIIVNGSKLDDLFIITGTSINVVGSRLVNYVEIESLEVNGRRGLDTFNVDTTIDGDGNLLATSSLQMLAVSGQQDNDLVALRGMLAGITATFSGGADNDTFTLKSLAPLTVNAIHGPVTINGDEGQDTLIVCDTGDAAANTGALTGTTLTGLGMAGGLTYGTLEALNISLGSGGDTFTIHDTHTGATVLNSGSGDDTVHVQQIQGTTTVNAAAGNDTINVGSLAPSAGGAVNQIAASLIINGGNNADTLNVDDTGDATANDGVLTATRLTGLGMGVGVTYGALEALNISLGAGGNSFNVKATAAGTATTLNSGLGDDVLTVDSNGASLNGTVNCVVSSLTINGQDGFNVLTLEDYSDNTGDQVHVTPTQVGAATGDTFFGTGGSLTYSELDQMTLNMSQAYLPDTIYLTPSRLGTEFFIRARDPQTPMQRAQLPGDALYLDFTGLTAAERLGVRLNATGLNNPADPIFNTWNIPEHGRVNYKQIEKMNHVQTVAVGADLGGQEPRVRVIDAETGLQKFSFLAFAANFKGGVRVAVGDVNGDAIPDIITSAGPGGGPEVRVFNGATGAQFTGPMGSFFAFQQGSNTTVYVAVADFNMDGLADIVTGSDSGVPIIKVFDSHKLLTGQANPVMSQFAAYDRHITGGARLAVGDLTGDGVPDIAAAPVSGLRSEVRIFATSLSADQATVSHSLFTRFTAFPNYNGAINIAVGDVNGDGRADVVVGTDSGGSSRARIYDGATLRAGAAPTLLAQVAPFGKQPGGARLALVDVDGDGVNELLAATTLAGSKVKPKAFRLQPNSSGGLTTTAIDAVFAGFASDPFFEGALFLAGGN